MGSLPAALLGGGGAMLGWGTSDFFAKKTIDEIGDLTTLFWGQVIGCAVLSVFVGANGYDQHFAAAGWAELVALGLVSGWSYLILYRGFGKGSISVLSPLFAAYAGVAALVALLAFHEHLSGWAAVALPFIFVGILFMATDIGGFRRSIGATRNLAGVPEVLTAMLVFAGWIVLWDRFLQGRSWSVCMLLMRSVAAVSLLLYALTTGKPLAVSRKGLWPVLVGIGVCDVAAYSALSYGFTHSDLASVVALLSGAFSLPTLLLARIFLRERLALSQACAAGVILGGVALLAVAQ